MIDDVRIGNPAEDWRATWRTDNGGVRLTMLGSREPLKSVLAERTYLGLSSRALNCTFWGEYVDNPETNLLRGTAV